MWQLYLGDKKKIFPQITEKANRDKRDLDFLFKEILEDLISEVYVPIICTVYIYML